MFNAERHAQVLLNGRKLRSTPTPAYICTAGAKQWVGCRASTMGAPELTLKMFLARMFSMQLKQTLCLQGTKAMVAGISSRQI